MIDSIEKLYEFYHSCDCYEHEFNSKLLDLYTNHQITKEVFVEYLEITQSDINDCFEEIFN